MNPINTVFDAKRMIGRKFSDAQIQADIKPFEGILLGVFFMTAGAGLDPSLVLEEAPTLALGIVARSSPGGWLGGSEAH